MNHRSSIWIVLMFLGTIGCSIVAFWSLASAPAHAQPVIFKRTKFIKKNGVSPAMINPTAANHIIPSIAQLGINLGGAYYQASGNQFIAGNNQNWGLHPFECTEFAYGRAIELGLFQNGQGIGAVVQGNANNWDNSIASSNYRDRLNTKVRERSIVVWEANQSFQWSEGNRTFTEFTDPVAGHVAFVEQVYPDGSFLITEGRQQATPIVRIIKGGTPPAVAAKFIYL